MMPRAHSVVRRLLTLATVLSASSLIACAEAPEPGSSTEAAEAPTGSPSPAETPAEVAAAPTGTGAAASDPAAVAAALPEQARAALPEAAGEAPPAPRAVVDPNAPGLADLRAAGEAIQEAIQAAAEAENGGSSSHCERGYRGIEASVRSLGDQLGTTGARRVPDRERFLTACSELPEPVQQCLVMSYALANRAECEQHKNELDPALRERIQALMRGE